MISVIVASCLCLSTDIQSVSLSEDFYGAEYWVAIELADFRATRLKRSIVKQDDLFYGGKKVWKWTSDTRPPRNYVTEITLRVGSTEYKLPASMLDGLVDLHVYRPEFPGGREFNGWLWLNEDKRSWGFMAHFSDGGNGFSAYFTGQVGSSRVKRRIEHDRRVTEETSGTALVRKVGSTRWN